jgi:hypothetical protein
MATTCSGCVKALPEFNSIQKQFGNKVCIIPVTYEKKEKVKNFLQKHPAIKLPMIGEDTVLTKYFPHTFISHEVWIKNGIVKAITYTEYVTVENIQTILAGKPINWHVKNDELDRTSSLHHYSIIDLYLRSYNIYRYPYSHVVLEVKDTNRFINTSGMYNADWKLENTFCYDSIIPSLQAAIKNNIDRKYLDDYFGLYGRMEKRKMPCYLLTSSDTKPVRGKKPAGIQINIANLIYTLNRNFHGTPFIDATGNNDLLTISEGALKDMQLLKAELKRYSLELVKEEREMEVLVITETKF